MKDRVGDQHKSNGPSTTNPFEEVKPQPTLYTASEIATLQSRLDKQLGPEYISARPGASGQKVHYLAGEKVINLANEVFGFNGWSSSIQNIQIDFVDEHAQTGKISMGLSVIVRVTLKDGSYHEDIGYGHIENCKGKAAAFAKAKKEGTTDALKRALRTFGKVLGNCVYDKEFLSRVTRMKVGKGRWNEDDLYRHPDFVPVRRDGLSGNSDISAVSAVKTDSEVNVEDVFDAAEFEDAEFDEGDFIDPDHIILPDPPIAKQQRGAVNLQQQTRPNQQRDMTTPSRPPNARTATAPAPVVAAIQHQNHRQSLQPSNSSNLANNHNRHPSNQRSPARPPKDPSLSEDETNLSSPGLPSLPFNNAGTGQPSIPTIDHAPDPNKSLPTAFYTARAADLLDEQNNPLPAPGQNIHITNFNPHAETPSIRKTAGVNHNRSGPLRRDTLVREHGVVPPVPNRAMSPGGIGGRDFIDPRAEASRRVGAPGQANVMSPGPARPAAGGASAYRPPTRRGVAEAAGTHVDVQERPAQQRAAAKRPPLGDMSNIPPQLANMSEGNDAKRVRLSGPGDASGLGFDGAHEIIVDKAVGATVAAAVGEGAISIHAVGKENVSTTTNASLGADTDGTAN